MDLAWGFYDSYEPIISQTKILDLHTGCKIRYSIQQKISTSVPYNLFTFTDGEPNAAGITRIHFSLTFKSSSKLDLDSKVHHALSRMAYGSPLITKQVLKSINTSALVGSSGLYSQVST